MTILDANFLNYNSNSFEVTNDQLYLKYDSDSGLIMTPSGLSISFGSGILNIDDKIGLNILTEDWNIGSIYRITGVLDPIENLDIANKQFVVNSIDAVEHPDIGTDNGQFICWDNLKYRPILTDDIYYDKLNHRIGFHTINPRGIIDIRGSLVNEAIAGTASATSEQDSTHNADKAFDNNNGTLWGNNNTIPVTLQYDFGSGITKIINTYSITFNNNIIGWENYDFSPNNWILKGSIDGSEWDTLDTRINEGWNDNKTKIYICNNITPYRFYAIEITDNKGTVDNFVGVVEFQLYSDNAFGIIVSENGFVGFGTDQPARKIEIIDYKQSQLRLTYESAVNYTDLFTNIDGDFEINPSIGNIKLLKNLKTDRWINSETNTFIGIDVIGDNSLIHNTGSDGYFNTIYGNNAGYSITSGYSNVIIGYNAAYDIQSSFQNIIIGKDAAYHITSSYNNISIGAYSLFSITQGYHNLSLGTNSGFSNTIGNNNINIGTDTNYFNEEGNNNTIIGYQAGKGTSLHNKTGNVFIGYQTGYNEIGSNKLYIANSDTLTPLIKGDFSLSQLYINNTLGINNNDPKRNLDIFNTVDPQIRLTHTIDDKFVDLQSDSLGNLLFKPSSGFIGLNTIPETTIDIIGTAFLLPIPDTQLSDSLFKTSQLSTYIDGGALHFKVKDSSDVLHNFRYKTIEELALGSTHLTSNAWGELDSNYNFPGWTYITTDRVAHDGCFEITSNSPGSTEYITTEYIPINPFKKYSLTGWFKSIGAISNGFIYAGFIAYDKDKNRIGQENYLHNLNTETTLSQILEDGDTEIHLTDVSNWDNSSTIENRYMAVFDDPYYSNLGTYYYTQKIAIYNEGSVNGSTNTITLSIPWDQGTINTGTPIANTRIQNNYDYDVIQAEQIPNTWEFRSSGIVTGISESIEDNNAKFKPATAFIRQTVLETNQENIYTIHMDGFETKVEINEFIDKNYPQLRLTNIFDSYYTDLTTDQYGYLTILPSNKRVGINTLYPSNNPLEIFDDSTDYQLRLTNVMDTGFIELGSDVNGNLMINTSSGNILTNNNFGIGIITTLNRKFDVVDDTNPQIRASHTENLHYAEFQVDSSGYLDIITSGNIISTSSKFGIGGIQPTRNFEIFDNSNPQLKLTQTESNNFVEFQVDSDSNLNITPNLGLVSILSKLDILKSSGSQLELIQLTDTNFANFRVNNSGNLYIIASGDDVIIENKVNIINDSDNQLELIHTNGSKYSNFKVDSSGNLIINVSNQIISTSSKLNLTHSTEPQLELIQVANTSFAEFQVDNSGILNISTSGANVNILNKLKLTDNSNPQLQLIQDGNNFVEFQLDGSGDLNIDVNNGIINTGSITLTTLIATTLQLGTTSTITSILDEDNLNSDSDVALATQQSIKAYVDNIISGENIWNRVLTTLKPATDNDNLNIGSGILNSGSLGINILTSPARKVEILDDANPQLRLTQEDAVNFAEFQVNDDGTLYLRTSNNTIVPFINQDNFGSSTLRWNISSYNINTTTLQLGTTKIITSILDENDLNSDSDVALATQQSIKAYVDDTITGGNLWKRTSTTLEPNNDNDNLDIGTGILNSGYIGINMVSASSRRIEVLDNTNPQIRLTHTVNTDFVDLKVDTDGYLTFITSGNTILPGTNNDKLGSSSLRWDLFSHNVQINGNITHTGTNIGFLGATPVAQQSALTSADGSTVDTTYGTEEQDVIQNLVTRVAELEAVLQAFGLIA
jgi:hypothetical protein